MHRSTHGYTAAIAIGVFGKARPHHRKVDIQIGEIMGLVKTALFLLFLLGAGSAVGHAQQQRT